ncbi:Tex family protein [Desulfocurvibacter africanus]|uniref:Tex-like protein n=1 Tax=Desulfocurvibacter africanus subsp. africanus str. Walvis Bay TaxID=690850 RepID=F3YWL0_DESAF|nr:Tex family protein [Desulfocurvibacter africanus]EGJ50503.1 Tex-like protein [Desulfocurvibacter africanus subsp. africanus str. Walvis Bay]
MSQKHIERVAAEFGLKPSQIQAVAELVDGGATVPFIARYRKEATGSLDEVAVTAIRDRLEALAELDKRREAILSSLEERGLLTDELKSAVVTAPSLAELEDIYLPYRPKRRTRAMIAMEKGLEPLALAIMEQGNIVPAREAEAYVNADKGIGSVDEALAGARDIIAERVSEHAVARADMRRLFAERGLIHSRLARGKDETEAAKFRDYLDWEEKAAPAAGHRILAMLRGEREGFLSVSIRPPEDMALWFLNKRFVKGRGPCQEQVVQAIEDGYKRLLAPSMENEMRAELKKRADAEAIAVFAANLRELLLASPLGQKRIMALDPGFRTGAKLACLDAQGRLLHHETIFPTGSEKQSREAGTRVRELTARFAIEAVAVGNGTAGRETEAFVRGLALPGVAVVMVNESGASVYSASEIAREEFPDLDLTVRGAASIGRRLIDPLAELVKIEPKAIGVGQYQHDVDQADLKRALDDTVVSCVNAVGVELNTASPALLSHVSGLGPTLAKNIAAWRDENGPFGARRDLLKVKRLGPKAFEQAAGFLRIREAMNPLDASAVHPERYALVERMAKDLGASVAELMRDAGLRERVDLKKYVSADVGLPTLTDIMAELARPGRDPRPTFEAFSFAEGVNAIGDLEPGMVLPGVVTNVTRFGAFIDVGVHQDGLAHVSQIADRYVKDPAEVVRVGQKVTARVLEVDKERKRISLSLKKA